MYGLADRVGLWVPILTICVVVTAVPGFLMAPYSIHFFDEPYQILTAYDWKNGVYSPLSSWFGHWVGEFSGWRYIAFRQILIFLVTFSIYISSLYALLHTRYKLPVVLVGALSVFFATVFKSDMNIYGWDHWSEVFIVANLLLALNILEKWSFPKVALWGVLSGLTVLTRLPNVSLLVVAVMVMFLYAYRRIGWRSAIVGTVAYIFAAVLTIWCVISLLYGSFSEYVLSFKLNAVGAHSVGRIIKPLLLSIFSILRFMAIVFAGYGVIWLTFKKVSSFWVRGLIYLILLACYFILLVPLRRAVLGNVIEMSICLSLLGIGLLIVRGRKTEDREMILYAITVLLFCCISVVGSNWGMFKYLAWPSIPLLAALACRKLTPEIQTFSLLTGGALLLYSFYSYWRPTFFDGNLNHLTHRMDVGVLDGMYTTEERASKILEIETKTRNYREMGYTVVPLRSWNDYLWEYFFMNFNPYQRHNFDYAEAFNDAVYVENIISDAKRAKAPVLILYLEKETNPPTLMYRRLNEEFNQVDRGSFYSIYAVRK